MFTAVLFLQGTALLNAATFGDSVDATSGYLDPCADNTAVSMPLSIDVSSRISVSSVASVQSFNAQYASYATTAILRDQADTKTLAYSSTPYIQGLADANSVYLLPLTGVLHNGSVTYAAPPGNYLLKLNVHTYGLCSGNGPYLWTATLSYILLSSYSDRIFAAGFNAMILNPSQTQLMA